MKIVGNADLRDWYGHNPQLSDAMRSIGAKRLDAQYLETELGMPYHLRFVVDRLMKERGEVSVDDLASIPFYSLCKGLFLPLASMSKERVAQIFGIAVDDPPDAAAKEVLVHELFQKEIGLDVTDKLACALGDPFRGRPSSFRRDSMVRLLMSVDMKSRRTMLDRLPIVGDVSILFAEARPQLHVEPQMTASEVLHALRIIPDLDRNTRFELLRSLLLRCGRLEAFFLARLLLRKAGFGFDYQQPLLARAIAQRFDVPQEEVSHAMALTDAFAVVDLLEAEGRDGLRKVRIQPLVALRPALAGGTTEEIPRYPVWVERKYDGIRLMLHKSTDALGGSLCAAYTRNRGDWMELVRGLESSIRMLPGRSLIVDGELFGTIADLEGSRPATVYEVYKSLQGEGRPLRLKYAAFDLVYAEGQDLTKLPLSERRRRLSALIAPIAHLPLPVPISLAEGQLASSAEDLNRLYQHFRAQKHEGVIAKNLDGPYLLASRDPSWLKKKPVITLDLVLLGAVFAVTSKEHTGRFGSYVIAARTADGRFEDVGDVAGPDQIRDAEIQAEIMREGLITGRRIERPSASGVRPGLELRPHIVATVKFEGITKDGDGRLALRSPKLAYIRSDKSAFEADLNTAIEALYLQQRIG